MKRRPKLSLSRPAEDIENGPDAFASASASASSASPKQTREVRKERTATPVGSNPSPTKPGGDAPQQPPSETSFLDASSPNDKKLQSLSADEFFYFFLRMRKGEVKRIVSTLQTRYPQEDPGQLSERLIASKSPLALLGGTLLSLPWLVPGIGQTLKLAGIVGANSILTRMNLYLINEIALVFGEDIDDAARVSDMMAVVAATAIGSAAPGVITQSLSLNPWFQLPTAALSSAATTQLIGRAAIRHFRRKGMDRETSHGEFAAPVSG